MKPSSADATNPRNFAWVSANAGSGKTRLLTDRVTRLLLSGANVSRILCLTYTKAAAAEMAGRLFARLGGWALLPDDELQAELEGIAASPDECDDLRRARRLFAQALETPGGLKIQTIHSFCQNLLARFPVEAGIPTRFSVLAERDTAELLAQARNQVLASSAGNAPLAGAIALLASRASDGRFADMLNAAVAGRTRLHQMLALHGADPDRFLARLRQILGVAEGETDTAVISAICRELAAEKPKWQQVAAWLAAGSANDQKTADRVKRWLRSGVGPESYILLRTIFFTDAHTPRASLVTDRSRENGPKLAAWLDGVQIRFASADDHQRRAATATMTGALLRTAFSVLERYEQAKRARAALDYDDLISATIRLLETGDAAAWVLYKLDGGIDHILVDEGQDTSREQWRIVSRLAEEFFDGSGARHESIQRRLFVVGDEKQSIFSFQGAEPTAFGQFRESFRQRADGAYLPFVDYRPAISRRSAQSILSFVDTVFEPEAARDGLTATSDPIQHEAHRRETGRVEIWPLIPAPPRKIPEPLAAVDAPVPGAHTILAAKIAGRIAGWLNSGLSIDGGDPVTAGDIMILVRRRNAFAEEMIRALLDRAIPVAGADRMVLMEQIAVLDLLALGHFVLLPEDDLNLAALLKSPILGCTESDVYDLARPRQGSLWRELCERSHERESFRQAHSILIQALSDADRAPPFEFYSRILNHGARKRLIARLGLETPDAIDEFLALALAHENGHSPSLQGFLHWFGDGGGDVKRDMELGGGAVRVMTVHGAKGLEAKVVILPDTFQTPDHERRGTMLYTDDCAFAAMPKHLECDALAAAKSVAHLKETREYRRLLYVAATRARDLLVVCGYQAGNRKEPPPESWYALMQRAAQKLGRAENIDGQTVTVIGVDTQSGIGAAETKPDVAMPEFLGTPAKPERMPLLLQPSRALGAGEPPVNSPVRESGKGLGRGLLLHALLASLPDVPAAVRQKTGEALLGRRGVVETEARTLVAEAMRVLNDPEFAPLFSDGSRSEVAVTARLPELGGAQLNGQIDRLVVTGDKVLIADFKTNRSPPAAVSEIPKLYLAQMALYRAAIQKIYPDKQVACALIWTESAQLMPLENATLDSEMQSLIARMAAISTAESQLDHK
jgi:ATP-dependent helicase/nuclease subunit A